VYIAAEGSPKTKELNIVILDKAKRIEIIKLFIGESESTEVVDLGVNLLNHFISKHNAFVTALEDVYAVKVGVLMEHNLVHIELVEVSVKEGYNAGSEFHHNILPSFFFLHIYYSVFFFNFQVFSLVPLTKLGEKNFFSLVSQQSQRIFKKSSCYRAKLVLVFVSDVVLPRGSGGVFIFEIDFAGSDAVAHHFCKILRRHNDGFSFTIWADILPVFRVVFVVSFVMEPGFAISVRGALSKVR
jgi:hypothetical protein